MVASLSNSVCKTIPTESISGKRRASSRVIVNGLIKLVDGQKSFANEFGLPFNRVFRHSAEVLRNNDTRQVIKNWLRDDQHGATHLSALLSDIIEHNLALCAALDGIAAETLEQLSPLTTRSHCSKLFGRPIFIWRTFKKRLCAFLTNDYLRHQQLVVAGFSKAYDQQRGKRLQHSSRQ